MSEREQLSPRSACERITAIEELQWQWEDRFGTVVATLEQELETRVREVLESAFEGSWSSAEISDAPAQVVALADTLGGLRGGQLLLATATSEQVLLFCAWWPWGNGTRVSIRIGSQDDNETKAWFGV